MVGEASNAAAAALEGGARRRLTAGPTAENYPYTHLDVWGPPKVGKSHFALGARTHELSTPPKMDGFTVVEEGKMLIPSKPLRIAFANFDRDPSTVVNNLPPDSDIMMEAFYLTPEGEPMYVPDKADIERVLRRYQEFMNDAVSDGCHLLFHDGGTITWEDVRTLKLPAVMEGKTPEGEARHLPRQYGAANDEMRKSVGQRLYGLKMHTVMSREAGQKWAGQNSPEQDPAEPDGVTLRPDGWNKSGHYVDASVKLQLRDRNIDGRLQKIRQAKYTMALKPTLINVEVTDPTFAKIHSDLTDRPLLLPEDWKLYAQLIAKGEKVTWR